MIPLTDRNGNPVKFPEGGFKPGWYARPGTALKWKEGIVSHVADLTGCTMIPWSEDNEKAYQLLLTWHLERLQPEELVNTQALRKYILECEAKGLNPFKTDDRDNERDASPCIVLTGSNDL